MRTRFARLSALAALAVPLGAMGASAAPAAAAEGTTCAGNSGTIKLSPGLTNTAKAQNIVVHGTQSGCVGGGVTKGSYVAHLKTVNAVTFAALKSPGEPTAAESSTVIKWGAGNSHGTFSMPLTESPGISIGGTLSGGPFEGMSVSGTVSQTFTGGATCGVAEGKKKAKAVKSGTFTGSAVTIA